MVSATQQGIKASANATDLSQAPELSGREPNGIRNMVRL